MNLYCVKKNRLAVNIRILFLLLVGNVELYSMQVNEIGLFGIEGFNVLDSIPIIETNSLLPGLGKNVLTYHAENNETPFKLCNKDQAKKISRIFNIGCGVKRKRRYSDRGDASKRKKVLDKKKHLFEEATIFCKKDLFEVNKVEKVKQFDKIAYALDQCFFSVNGKRCKTFFRGLAREKGFGAVCSHLENHFAKGGNGDICFLDKNGTEKCGYTSLARMDLKKKCWAAHLLKNHFSDIYHSLQVVLYFDTKNIHPMLPPLYEPKD